MATQCRWGWMGVVLIVMASSGQAADPAGKGDKPAEKPKWEGSIMVAGEKSKAELAALAKVSLTEAEKAGLAAAPGGGQKKAVEVELEVENGFLVYEVEVVLLGGQDEWTVIVDAGTGKVLAVETDKDKSEHPSGK